jgi:hypothetical protein
LEFEMNLTQEMKDFVHLMARAMAKVRGVEDPVPFADTVLEHAIAEAPKVGATAPATVAAPE